MPNLDINTRNSRTSRTLIAIAVLAATCLAAAPASLADGPSEGQDVDLCAYVPMDPVKMTIIETAMTFDVEPEIALAIAEVESGFDAAKIGDFGAVGVMQVKPFDIGDVFQGDVSTLAVTDINVSVGVRYLKHLYRLYGNRMELALAHYKFGPIEGDPLISDLSDEANAFVQSVFAARGNFQHDLTAQCFIKYQYSTFTLAGGESVRERPAPVTRPIRISRSETSETRLESVDEADRTETIETVDVADSIKTTRQVRRVPDKSAVIEREFAYKGRALSISGSTTYPYGYDQRQLALKQRFAASVAEREAWKQSLRDERNARGPK
jgi:hypothetical protein